MSSNITLLDAIKWGQKQLEEAKINNSRFEAEVLMAHVMGQSRGEIYINFPLSVLKDKFDSYKVLIEKRAGHYPTQYLTGIQEFMSLQFKVTPDVLIPRQDTEVLVEKVIDLAKKIQAPRILDLCTGSGAIAVSLAKYIPGSTIYAADISQEALEIARKNADKNNVNINFIKGDLFNPLKENRFDIIASNPPYIPAADIATLMPEIRDFEPARALDGGEDGLGFYRRIIKRAPSHLMDGGFLMLEIGYDQANAVQELFQNQGIYGKSSIVQDYGGRDRVVFASLM